MRFLLATALALFALVASAAADTKDRPWTKGEGVLAEMRGVHLFVEDQTADAVKIGLTKAVIRERAEAVLREHGVPLFTMKDKLPPEQRVSLIVSPSVMGDAFSVAVRMYEACDLKRRNAKMIAVTWYSPGWTGVHGGDREFVLGRLADELTRFALAWTRQNPKR